MGDLKGVMKALNDHLLAKTFLVGERISLADIAVACTLLSLYKQVMDPAFRGVFGNVNRWFTTVVNQPNAKAVLGEVVLCSKEAQFDAKKFAEFSGKGDKKKDDKPKKEQPAKKEPEKKKEKPAPAEEEDDGMPKEPKAKDPLAALPKGTFDLEEWKRFYSNNDEDDSIKWFWEHFDAEHYSIWRRGRGSTPTTTRMTPSSGSGNTLMLSTTPSGGAITSSTVSSRWSSCPVTLLEVCSSALKR